MMSKQEAEQIVIEHFGADSGWWLWPFSMGWVVTFDVPSHHQRTPEGAPAHPGGAQYVLDGTTGELVPYGSLPAPMIAALHEERYGGK